MEGRGRGEGVEGRGGGRGCGGESGGGGEGVYLDGVPPLLEVLQFKFIVHLRA